MRTRLEGEMVLHTALALGGLVGVLLSAVGEPAGRQVDCATDREPPVAELTAPLAAAHLTGRNVILKASASDASGLARVRFFADRLGSAESSHFELEVTAAPWEATWTPPLACGARFAVAVDALDGCGNFASPASVFVTVDTACEP